MRPLRYLLVAVFAAGVVAAPAKSAVAAPNPGFYDNVPSNLAQLKNGTLIRYERETDFLPTFNHQSAAYRLDYRSTGQLGGPVMVSGMVFVPQGTVPRGGWPIVAWDHGTSGVGDQCNPSRWPDMYDGSTWAVYLEQIDHLLADGYAVTATDFEGLGTPGLHTYLEADALGRATIDGVRAFHQLVPATSTTWAAMGHSEGGEAAVAAGELAGSYGKGLTYVGAVAYAPAQHMKEGASLVAGDKFEAPYLAYMAVGMRSIDPSFDYENFVGPLYASRMADAETHCFDEWFFLDNYGQNPTPDTALNPSWASDPTVNRYFALSVTGQRKEAAPLLVLQGRSDFLYTTYPQYLKEVCSSGTVVHGITYKNVTHDAVIKSGWPDAEQWLRARFAGQPAPNDC